MRSSEVVSNLLVKNFDAISPHAQEHVRDILSCFGQRETDHQERHMIASTLVEWLLPDFDKHFSIREPGKAGPKVEEKKDAEKPQARRPPPMR